MNECIVIADILENTRQLGLYYIKQLDAEQANRNFTAEGYELNNATWLLGHLVWAENMLVLQALGHAGMNYPWLNQFAFGSNATVTGATPSFKELYTALSETHKTSQTYLRSLAAEALNEPTSGDLALYWDTKRKMLYHAIRHEGMHIGHISWLVKLHQLNK